MKIVTEAFGPRIAQERVMHECFRRFIVGDGADPVLSTSPFDVMFARGLFDESFYAAGIWFQRIFRYHAGRCRIKGLLDDGRYSSYTAPEDPRRDAEYRALVSDRRASQTGLDCLAGVIVFHEVPRWLTNLVAHKVPTLSDIAERKKFVSAMTSVREIWFEFGKETTDSLIARAVGNRLSSGPRLPELPRRSRRVVDP